MLAPGPESPIISSVIGELNSPPVRLKMSSKGAVVVLNLLKTAAAPMPDPIAVVSIRK